MTDPRSDDTLAPDGIRRVYAGRHDRTADDWASLGWKATHASELARSAHRAGEVLVMDDGGVRPLRHYPYHSPRGFGWGHAGGGPSDLARCILLDHYGVVPVCSGRLYRPLAGELPVRYQDFRYDVISRLPRGEEWSITSAQIDDWARGRRSG